MRGTMPWDKTKKISRPCGTDKLCATGDSEKKVRGWTRSPRTSIPLLTGASLRSRSKRERGSPKTVRKSSLKPKQKSHPSLTGPEVEAAATEPSPTKSTPSAGNGDGRRSSSSSSREDRTGTRYRIMRSTIGFFSFISAPPREMAAPTPYSIYCARYFFADFFYYSSSVYPGGCKNPRTACSIPALSNARHICD